MCVRACIYVCLLMFVFVCVCVNVCCVRSAAFYGALYVQCITLFNLQIVCNLPVM